MSSMKHQKASASANCLACGVRKGRIIAYEWDKLVDVKASGLQ